MLFRSDPILTDFEVQMNDVAVRGDTIWACGTAAFTVATASRRPKVFRSINGGTSWTTISAPFTMGTLAQGFNDIEFGFSVNPQLVIKNAIDIITLGTKLKDAVLTFDGVIGAKSGFVKADVKIKCDCSVKNMECNC